MPGGALPAGSQTAPAADARNRCQRYRRFGIRPGCVALRSGWWSLLPAATATAPAAVGRPSSSSAEPGGVAGRRGGSLEEQQYRGPEAEGEAAPGGLRTRQARVRPVTCASWTTGKSSTGMKGQTSYSGGEYARGTCTFGRVVVQSSARERLIQ